jgi:hypothetical protein
VLVPRARRGPGLGHIWDQCVGDDLLTGHLRFSQVERQHVVVEVKFWLYTTLAF